MYVGVSLLICPCALIHTAVAFMLLIVFLCSSHSIESVSVLSKKTIVVKQQCRSVCIGACGGLFTMDRITKYPDILIPTRQP